MEPVSPVLPDSAELEQVYKAQDGSDLYAPLPTFKTSVALITRWKLSDEEREYIAKGGDVFISILSGDTPIKPLMVMAAEPNQVLQWTLEEENRVCKDEQA